MNWLRRLLGMKEKVPMYGPQGVSLSYADGTIYHNVPSVYVGHDPDDECAVYEIMPPRDPAVDRPINVGFDVLPSMTAVIFPFMGIPKTDMPGAEIRKIDYGEGD